MSHDMLFRLHDQVRGLGYRYSPVREIYRIAPNSKPGSTTLKKLHDEGLVDRRLNKAEHVYEYRLTQKGRRWVREHSKVEE